MKALSLHQPWATMIAIGLKQLETRHWSTNYRGPLAIHAAQKWTKAQRTFTEELFNEDVVGHVLRQYGYTAPGQLPFGAVVCTVRLAQVMITEHVVKSHWMRVNSVERMLGDYSAGRYAWQLLDLKRFEQPIKAIGHQGFWVWNGESNDNG